MKTTVVSGTSVIVLCLAAGSANAGLIDLTQANTSVEVGGALFETADFRPAGTGYIDSFVRIKMNGQEEGYNTSGRPVAFDELTDPNFTRDLRLSEVPVVGIDGIDYYEFMLDINEASGANKNLISMDRAQVYTSPVGSQTTSNVASLGALRYNLDGTGDNWVLLDYDLNSGSGQGDMAMLVPTSAFAGAAGSDFVYLYSQFGVHNSADAGFEEWSVRTAVPSPGAVTLATIGLFLLAGRRRKAL